MTRCERAMPTCSRLVGLYIANPDLVERFRAGAPFNNLDTNTLYDGGARGYTDYPFLAVPAK